MFFSLPVRVHSYNPLRMRGPNAIAVTVVSPTDQNTDTYVDP